MANVVKHIDPAVKQEVKNVIDKIDRGTVNIQINENEAATFTVKKASKKMHVIYSTLTKDLYPLVSHLIGVTESEFTVFVVNDSPVKRDIEVSYLVF